MLLSATAAAAAVVVRLLSAAPVHRRVRVRAGAALVYYNYGSAITRRAIDIKVYYYFFK